MIDIIVHNEDRILELSYGGKVTAEDFAEVVKNVLPWIGKMRESGGFGVLTNLTDVEKFNTDAFEFFKMQLQNMQNFKQSFSAIVFKDRHSPYLKDLQTILVVDYKSFSSYFTEREKAYNYLKEKLTENE